MSRSHATRSRLILLVLSLVALAACREPTDRATTGSESILPTESAVSASPSEETPRTNAPTHTGTQPPRTNDGGGAPRYPETAGVGAMAISYLRSDPATSLVLEVDFVRGQRPTQQALDHVEQILERETEKPSGVSVRVDDEIPQRQDGYSFEDMEALESRYRDHRSRGSRAVLYVLSLNGDLADGEGTLGVAYRASGVAIFQERIRSAATSLVHPGAIERAVLTHEAGHVLGLVNIGYMSRHDHEDPDHPKHSRYKDSVMYWAIEDVSVASLLSGGPPSDFDRFDRDDLAMRRAG